MNKTYINEHKKLTIYYTQSRPSAKEIKEKVVAFETLFGKATAIAFGTFFEIETRIDVFCEHGCEIVNIGYKYITLKSCCGNHRKVNPLEGDDRPESYMGLYKLVIKSAL